MAEIQGRPIGDYSPEDQAFFRFWYAHMRNDMMQPPLADVSHATARYIWDAARAKPCQHAWQMKQYGATYHDLKCSICGEVKRETWD